MCFYDFLTEKKKTPFVEVMSLRPSVFARDLSANILSDFHENWLLNIHPLLNGVNKCVMVISTCRD